MATANNTDIANTTMIQIWIALLVSEYDVHNDDRCPPLSLSLFAVCTSTTYLTYMPFDAMPCLICTIRINRINTIRGGEVREREKRKSRNSFTHTTVLSLSSTYQSHQSYQSYTPMALQQLSRPLIQLHIQSSKPNSSVVPAASAPFLGRPICAPNSEAKHHLPRIRDLYKFIACS